MRHQQHIILQDEDGPCSAPPLHLPQRPHVTHAARQRALAGLVHDGVEVAVDDAGVESSLPHM
jgi:hypothetical protein